MSWAPVYEHTRADVVQVTCGLFTEPALATAQLPPVGVGTAAPIVNEPPEPHVLAGIAVHVPADAGVTVAQLALAQV
jgi:hypothetical protein